MGTIYIASRPITTLDSEPSVGETAGKGGEHLYYVYDPDGDPSNGNELVWRVGPEYLAPLPIVGQGDMIAENWVPMSLSEDRHYNTDPVTGEVLGNVVDPFDDRNFTPFDTGNKTAEQFMQELADFAESWGVSEGESGSIGIPYQILGPNSNSWVNSGAENSGYDLSETNPDGTYKYLPDAVFPAVTDLLDGAGDSNYTVKEGDDVNIIDGGGNDEITVQKGGHVAITNDNDPNSSDTIIIEGLDKSQVTMWREGNSLIILGDDGNGIPTYIELANHFGENGPGTTKIDFDPDGNGSIDDGVDPITFDPVTGQPTSPGDELWSIWNAIADWMQGVWDAFEAALSTGSPLVLDLDGDGVELVSLANTGVYWDIDEDGFAEATGWVAADDGFLAIDLDSDGAITQHTELFGSVTEDGFTALSVYDTNTDGVIDASDAQFGDLLVWRDANQNGISEAAELYTLAELDIVSIDLNATQVNQTNEGHDISHVSTYTVDDGVNGPQTLSIVDVWFQYDNVNTSFTGDYTLDIASLFVTTMRGYGNLPDLHVAASMDNDTSDPDSLMSLLSVFGIKDFADFFVQDGSVLSEVRDIIFRWAGVDGVDPSSRGSFVDARELDVLETIFDQTAYSGYNPGGEQGEAMSYAFDLLLQAIAPRLIAQTAGAQLFEGNFYYNPATDAFDGITGLNQDALDTLLAKAQDATQVSDKVAYWGDVVRVIDQIVGVANLSTGDASALETAITTSDSTLSTQLILDTLEWNSFVGEIIHGTSSADTLEGTTGDDTLYGSYGDDTITGGIGADTLRGQGDDDTLNGQSGDDFLFGESGNDTYLYFAGQGHDTITEESLGNDKIIFGPGVTFSDLTLTRISNTDLQIDLSNAVGGGTVTILNQFGNTNYALVELLEFNDSSTTDLSTINYTLTGTNGADTLKGIRYGGSQDDTIYGLDGNDTITGYFTTIDTGDNALYGGAGDDTIYGANGADYIDGGADAFVAIALIAGKTGLTDEAALEASGKLITV